jgi:L-fuculose-phosphate aldolase
MVPDMIELMPLEGAYGDWAGPLKPSTEWRFHLDIMRARPDVGSVVDTHSTYATVLAIARKSIPACHYMIAAFGGTDQRNGCLLANHGMIAVGADLDKAMWLAGELETIARQYYLSLALGSPVILSDADIEETAKRFASYGLQDPPAATKARASAAERRTEKRLSGAR